MKQTAVEWLIEKWSNQGTLHSSDISQAKEIEKQQIIEAYESGNYENGMGISEPEQYYDETFKKK